MILDDGHTAALHLWQAMQSNNERMVCLCTDLEFAERKLRIAASPARIRPVSSKYLKQCEREVRKARAALAAFLLSQ